MHIYSSDQLGPSVLRIAARPVVGAYFVLYLKKMSIKQEISFCAAIPAKALSVRRLYIAVGAPGSYAALCRLDLHNYSTSHWRVRLHASSCFLY